MSSPILGLHHVTATVDAAQDDLDFCVGALGMRLVKKTVNFDNHHVYHFYYGDEIGTPGTLWTTFPYQGHGVPGGRKGAGQVVTTSFSVPGGSLSTWRTRLAKYGIAVTDLEERFGDAVIAFADPSGLEFELIANKHDHRTPWVTGDMDASTAIHGLHTVTMVVRDAKHTLDLMQTMLGFHVIGESGNRMRVGVHGGGPGKAIDIVVDPAAAPAANGIGTVHHVAMAVADGDEQRRMREELLRYGCKVTEVRDRCYFTSIYFREPGGVLFEIATLPPGFLIDEPKAELGQSLKLPYWEEPSRREIEKGLAAVVLPS
jgi:glyoxalase family protein